MKKKFFFNIKKEDVKNISRLPYERGTILASKMGKLRHWEVISLAQAHTVQKWQSRISDETVTDVQGEVSLESWTSTDIPDPPGMLRLVEQMMHVAGSGSWGQPSPWARQSPPSGILSPATPCPFHMGRDISPNVNSGRKINVGELPIS